MLSLTIGNGSEIEIETPSGKLRLVFYKKNNGGRGVRIFAGDTKSNRWPITRTNLVRKVTKFCSEKVTNTTGNSELLHEIVTTEDPDGYNRIHQEIEVINGPNVEFFPPIEKSHDHSRNGVS